MAKFDPKDGVVILTPRLVGDIAWRHACGRPVEDTVRKIPDILVYLLRKYPVVPQWLFVDTIRQTITDVEEMKGEVIEVPISEGKAVQLINEARQAGLFEEGRPEGAATNLLYFFTEEQKAKLLRIRRIEALGYALSLEQAKKPDDPTAGRTDDNAKWFRHPSELTDRKDNQWRMNMARLSKLLRVLGLSIALSVASAPIVGMAMAYMSDPVKAGDLSGTQN